MCPFFMLKFFFIFLFLLCFAQLDANIYFELNRKVVNSYQKGISFDYTGFERLQNSLKIEQPSNGLVLLLENYKDLIRLLIDEDQKDYQESLGNRIKRLDNLKLANQNSPFYYYCLSECYLQWAIIRIRYNDHVRGANDLRKAASYLSIGQKRFPDFYMFLKPAALISAMASAVPENFKWLSNLAGVSGTMKDSNSKLDSLFSVIRSSKSFNFIEDELTFIKILLTQNLSQIEVKSNLNVEMEASPLLQFAMIWQSSKMQKSASLLNEISKLKSRIYGLDFCYLNYLQAEAELNLLRNPTKSIDKFQKCTNGQTYIKAAHRKLAWYHALQNDTAQFKAEMKLVLQLGNSYTDDDKQAIEEASTGVYPNITLLKARLLFDGGQYSKVISLLDSNSLNFNVLQFRCEYYYRKGRALQELGRLQEAKNNFNNAILIGEKLPYYFAASSAYQLAIILLSENDRIGAKEYFEKVSRFPKHAYKTSMDMKAAAQLSINF